MKKLRASYRLGVNSTPTIKNPSDAIANKIAMVSEDRKIRDGGKVKDVVVQTPQSLS